jgi:hypothetical protein
MLVNKSEHQNVTIGTRVAQAAPGYRLDDQGVGSSSPDRIKNFLHSIQTL